MGLGDKNWINLAQDKRSTLMMFWVAHYLGNGNSSKMTQVHGISWLLSIRAIFHDSSHSEPHDCDVTNILAVLSKSKLVGGHYK
jgi:hypothetical protein